ncbi:TVP38/TMEM64 family protein [Crateriforma conspicua]|uniref:TVP38/TMEM64 family protein n=1 Tax=Crateriforma conspicua TaxID=2527996 RepID=UPI001E579B25|nr:TVP38/TMEM64 family protein [Crateriforma conspicua]
MASEKPDRRRWMTRLRLAGYLVIAVSALVIVRSLPLDNAISHLQGWITDLGFWGPFALVVLYILATVLFVPGTLLTLVAGAVFGLGIGTAIVSVGSTVGSAFAFLIARYAARDSVERLASNNRHFAAMDRAIGEGGWKIVGLLRLSPAIPFNVQNYLYGLTPIGFWPCVGTSWLAMLPGTFMYVYLGHLTGAAVESDRQRTTGEWILLGVGLLATIVVTVYVTRLASHSLKAQVAAPENTASSDETAESIETAKVPTPAKTMRTGLVTAFAVIMGIAAAYVATNQDQIAGLFDPAVKSAAASN